MTQRLRHILQELLKKETGQSAIIIAVSLTSFVALAGVSVEAGHGYYAYQQLVASTNAAALAAAQAMPNVTTATSNATAYSSASTGKNASPLLTNVVVTPTFTCSSNLAQTTSLNIACLSSSDGNSYNVVKVKQTASVPSWFAGMFGIKTFNIGYTSAAAIRGGSNTPWNIAIVLDATPSMRDPDSGTQCSGTQESCALKGVQALLANLYPCYLGQTCSDSSSTAVDAVSLFVFPPFTATTAPYAYCSGGSPSNIKDGYYIVSDLSSTYTYKITDFSNDYKASDTATALNTGSNIVKAAGYSGTGCAGITPPSTQNTYFAQAIYAAQKALAAQQSANTKSKNAMIILSDGDATANVSYTYSNIDGNRTATGISTSSNLQPDDPTNFTRLHGVKLTDPNTKTVYDTTTDPTYPSAVGECGQAVVAAKAAADAGTTVYTIGYGAYTYGGSSYCKTDKTYSTTVTTGGGSWASGYSPCQALAAMASSTANFYSDAAHGCKATLTSNQNFTTLTAIFRQITASLTTPRLVTLSML